MLLGWTALRPAQTALAQNVCATPGKDGTLFTTAPNTYYPGVGTAPAGAITLSIGSARTGTGASATVIGGGDLLLIIQMQGADINSADNANYGSGAGTGNGNLTTNFTAGQYEYALVSSVGTNSVTLSTALKNTKNVFGNCAAQKKTSQ